MLGATPGGLLETLGARDRSFASWVLAGWRRANQAYDLPVLGRVVRRSRSVAVVAIWVTALGAPRTPQAGGDPDTAVASGTAARAAGAPSCAR